MFSDMHCSSRLNFSSKYLKSKLKMKAIHLESSLTSLLVMSVDIPTGSTGFLVHQLNREMPILPPA